MKKVLIGILVIMVILAVVLAVGLYKLGPIIKTTVNTHGPRITQTEVRLADVGVSLLKGELQLKGFVLGNPKGFQAPHAVKVGSMYVDVDESSLTEDTVVIDKVAVIGPEIYYEKTGKTDNFKALLRNIKGASPAKKEPSDTTEKEGAGKKILVRDFVLKDGQVNLAASIVGTQSVTAQLPDIHLKDIGKSGAPPEQVFGEIFAAIYKEVSSPAVTRALNTELKKLKKDAKKKLEKAGEDLKDAAKEEIKKQTEKTVEDVSKGLKGLLGEQD